VAVGVVIAMVAVVAAGAWTYRVATRVDPVKVRVVAGGHSRTVEVKPGSTVSTVLAEARARPRDGRLLSAVEARTLDPKLDPARVTLDGIEVEGPHRVDSTSKVRIVRVIDGTDQTEKTRTVEEVIPTPVGPDVLRHVEEPGRPGRQSKTIGVTSGEVVATKVLQPAVAPARTTRKVVALTFDDGPTTKWTPYVLAVLSAKGVKATFCEVGQFVGYYPEMSRQVVAAGHRLCNHTLGHDEGLATADQARIDAQLMGGRAALTDKGLPAPLYYRPPGGNLSDLVIARARAADERVLIWSIDTKDWQAGSTTDSILAKVRAGLEPGAIILLHDAGGKDRTPTIAALGLIIDELRAQGYGFTFPTTAAGAPPAGATAPAG